MASSIGYQLSLEDFHFVDTWLRCFAASARTKKLKGNKKKGGEKEITDLFLATARSEAIIKVCTMVYPTNLKDLIFEEISQIIRRNMRPKKRLIVAERTNFMSKKQQIDGPIIKYLHHLRNASRNYEFEKLVQIALKRTIFKQYENSKRKTLKELKKTQPIWKSFHLSFLCLMGYQPL